MIGRILIGLLATVIVWFPAGPLRAGDATDDTALRREEDMQEVVVTDDDDDGDDSVSAATDADAGVSGDTGNTGRSRDRTGSRETAVSLGDDESQGDLTRDRTRDGRGGLKRDWSGNHTNDASRNDTR